MIRTTRRTALSTEQLSIAWQACSLVLGYPDEALIDRIAARIGAQNLDDYTRAHLLEARARIAKALDAGLQAERR